MDPPQNISPTMKVSVSTVDTEVEFEIANKTKAKDLFHHVSKNLGVHEYWYFGLLFNSGNDEFWIDQSKKTVLVYKDIIKKLKYRAKFYPENVDELIEEITVKYFYLQVRSAILSDKIYCPPETCVLLASYACQVRHGDFKQEIEDNGILSKEKLLPDRVIEQHTMDNRIWLENIVAMWKKHHSMMKEDAMMEYLRLAQNLEMFGVHYFDITNKKGTNLILGINATGLNIYKDDDRLNPSIQFPWSEIGNISYSGTKFMIRYTDKKATPFIFFAKDAKINKKILNLGIGYHTLYVMRRKPETLEITRMKAKAADRRKLMVEQRQKFMEEKRAREEAEERERECLNQISLMKMELSKSRQDLRDAESIIQRLREQLEELQESKNELELQQRELRKMMEDLEEKTNMEHAERQKLEEQIRLKQMEVLRTQEEVNKKDAEARKLEKAVEEAKRHEEELRLRREEEERLWKEMEEKAREERERLAAREPELVSVNEDLKAQLKELQEKLELARKDSLDTQNDKIHRQNVAEGRNKYQTLANIRKGNTTRRVDMFENF